MADELQGLLDRINKEGLEKAEAEKKQILEEAEKEAKAVVDKAKAEAEDIIKDAKREAATLQASGEAGLQQASRDVLISLESQLKEILSNTVKTSVGEAMTADQLATIVGELAAAYARDGAASLQVLASEAQLEQLQQTFQAKLAAQFKDGMEIKPVPGVDAGVKVSFDGSAMVHDFTSDAVAEMLCAYLNPRILQVIRENQD